MARLNSTGDQLKTMREQMGRLGSSVPSAAGKVADQVLPPARQLMSYVEMATSYAPLVFQVMDRVKARGRQAVEPVLRPQAGVWRRVGRQRYWIAGFAVCAGLVAYGLGSGRLTALTARKT